MTNELQETLAARAERAATSPDAESWLQQITERRQRHVKRRRVALAAGGSSLAVVAVAVSVVATSGSDPVGHPSGLPAAGGPPASSRPAATHAVSPSVSLSAQPKAHNVLVAAPRAPRNAPAVLRLVPKGYGLVGVSGGATTYRSPKQDRNPNSFVGKVAVLIGDRYDPKTPAGRIAGYPATIEAGEPRGGDTAWIVRFYYSRTIEVDIQVPAGAGLGRELVHRMAETIDIRDVSSPGHG